MKLKISVVNWEILPRMKRCALRLGIPAAIVVGVGAIAYASVPVSFTPHSPLTAAELNANFTSLDGRVTTLETASPAVPSGAVMAFDLDACPSGWALLTTASGRTVVGVNPDMTVRTRGQTFGFETHTLTVAEMPSHTHTAAVFGATSTTFGNGQPGLDISGGARVQTNYGTSSPSSVAGQDQPHDIMQPSIAFLYCRKQ
jgi:hypothetical protein